MPRGGRWLSRGGAESEVTGHVTGPPRVFGVCGRVRVSVCPERPRVSAGTTVPPRVSLCHVEDGGCQGGGWLHRVILFLLAFSERVSPARAQRPAPSSARGAASSGIHAAGKHWCSGRCAPREISAAQEGLRECRSPLTQQHGSDPRRQRNWGQC